MGIFVDINLRKALKKGDIKFDPQLSDGQIGAGSIDLTLSNEFWRLKEGLKKKQHDPKKITFEDIFEEIKADSINIQPNELILGKTLERIELAPNICGWIQGRSKYARLGLSAHIASSFIQPGSHNRQVLEIVNLSKIPLTIHAGMRLCQIIFERTDSKAEKPYSKFGAFSKQ